MQTENLTDMGSAIMHPEHIDYSFIDNPLRNLVRSINRSTWARTAGCCAGSACHEKGNFYLHVLVQGLEGIRRFFRWLSLSRSMGCDTCIDNPSISAFALPDAEFKGMGLPGQAVDEWIAFDIRFHLGGEQPGRAQTQGGIAAMELGWTALEETS